MATCFDNIISFRGTCSGVEPTSGLYMDQVGIHKSEVESIMQSPYQNADAFFSDMQNIALQDIRTKIYTQFQNKYKATSIVSDGRIGHVQDNMQVYSASGSTLRGVNIELCNHISPIDLFVSEFSLFIDVSATVTIQVWDLTQNKQIDSFTVATTANEVTTVYPSVKISANRKKMNLFFGYDVSLYDQYGYTLNGGGCLSCNNSADGYVNLNSFIRARGIEFTTAEDKIPQNASGISHTGGISMVYSLGCNHQDWICSHANFLALPLLHKTAVEILEYDKRSTKRQNSTQLVKSAEEKQARIDAHEFKYREYMDSVLSNIKPPNDPLCYACNDRVMGRVVLP